MSGLMDSVSRVGVLIVQQGTPRAPTRRAVRAYLAQFLTDPRVIDVNPVIWGLILRLFVLPRRSVRTAALYRDIWTEAGSPLMVYSRAQQAGLRQRLGQAYYVELGMRYGQPSIPRALSALREAGADRVLVFPLFPQFSASTTGSVQEAVFRSVAGWNGQSPSVLRRPMPALRFVPPYYDDPRYLEALRDVISDALKDRESGSRHFLFSFHGLPRRYVAEGDPYQDHCVATAVRLAALLGLAEERWSVGFQSRFGREEWLRPYTEDVLRELGRKGARDLAVVCPGFAVDGLETLHEIGHAGARRFSTAGGGRFQRVPCLNDHPSWLNAMAAIVRRETAGWLPARC